MEIEDVRGLLPFYVTGKLSREQKEAVERALVESPSLRKELELWQHLRHAVQIETTAATAEHPTSEEIVLYAEKTGLDPQTRVRIEDHIQNCNECREVLEVILSTYPAPPWMFLKGLFAQLRKALRRFRLYRPMVAIPATVAAGLATFFLLREPPSGQMVQLVVFYEDTHRGTEESPSILPHIRFTKDTTLARLTLAFPDDPTASRYTVRIVSLPDSAIVVIPDLLSSGRYNELWDSVGVLLDESQLPGEGVFVLSASPVDGPKGFAYSFKLNVTRKR